MQRVSMNVLLVVGIMVGGVFQRASAKTAGFTGTSFISTNGGSAVGAIESTVVGPDGIKKGQCSYTDENGQQIKINYEETQTGQVTATSDSASVTDAQAGLRTCREHIAALQQDFAQSVQDTNQQFDEFERAFQDQMDLFNRQQESFAQQQADFLKEMEDFNKQFQDFDWD